MRASEIFTLRRASPPWFNYTLGRGSEAGCEL